LNPTVLFVHLGKKLPQYLMKNISRTKTLFPDRKIVLVHDQHANSATLSTIANCGVSLFCFEKDELSELSLEVPQLDVDTKFWNGYWQLTFERLFAVGGYQKEHPNEPLIHVESDVVLFPDFPFNSFVKLEKVAWPKVSNSHDVASIVYSPNFDRYSDLMKHLVEVAKETPTTNDMLALSVIAARFPERYAALPTMLSNDFSKNPIFGDRESWDLFRGIFDGLTLGYWLTGRDPKNAWGMKRRYLRPLNSPLDYASCRFSVDYLGRIRIDEKIPVFNLHVHSKNLGYFKTSNISFLQREMNRVNSRKNAIAFSLSGFIVTMRTHWKDLISAAMSVEKWSKLISKLMKKT
jgi:hypothetical protein